MNFPQIHGILVTDEHGNICDKDGTIVTQYADEQTRKLDLRVLMRFIADMKDKTSLFVVGYNTWKQMGGMFRQQVGAKNVVVSYEDRCEYLDEKVPYLNGMTLFNYSVELCLRRNINNIVVLGGRSVYLSFYNNYTCVTHCKVKIGDAAKGGKEIKVRPNTFVPVDKYLLNSPNIPFYCPINNETYSVTIYSHSLGE